MMAALTSTSGAPSKAAFDACLADLRNPAPGCLAVVLDVHGHGWAKAGTWVHVDANGRRCGWISAGCLDGELLAAAMTSLADGCARLLELDNRDLSDVFTGSGVGCRGRQWLLLLSLAMLPGLQPVLDRYRQQGAALHLRFARSGQMSLWAGDLQAAWRLTMANDGLAPGTDAQDAWELAWAPLPRAMVFGCGPESETLLPLLDQLGWRLDVVEPRPGWSALAARAERHLLALPPDEDSLHYDAALIMGHHFEQDRAALALLAARPVLPRYVGLLGATTRRRDLLATLPDGVRERLDAHLESPAGMPLGGSGAAAIALSLAARLQALFAASPA